MKRLITSALPYVNNVPHLGNIIGCVLSADVFARYCRSRGYETLYICGTDEYGTATENKAREEGLTPGEICDKYHAIHSEIYKEFNISFDAFGRTSTEEQTRIAQSIFKDLDKNGYISEHTSERTFCNHDGMFLADRYVEGICPRCGFENAGGDQCDQCGALLEPENLVNPKCKICGHIPVLKSTTHLHLDMDKLQEKVETWFKKQSIKGSWTHNALTTTKSWLEKGLSSRPITRDLKWGIPVPKPGFEGKVFYVWFDAPIGYISITAKAIPGWEKWWLNPGEVQLYQFMAKDNIPFHTVLFPASLIGTGHQWTLLHHINSTEYLNYEDSKFSKSRGIGVFGTDVKKTGIPIDLWRFYLLAIRPEKNDTFFSWSDFFGKVNFELIDNIGNLINRVLVYIKKNFNGEIRDHSLSATQKEFISNCRKQVEKITRAMEESKLREALRLILLLSKSGNKFFQDSEPWAKIKKDREEVHATTSILIYLIRNIAILVEPFMPDTAKRIFKMLNLIIDPEKDSLWKSASVFKGLNEHFIGTPEILYKKLDPKDAEKWRKRFSGDGKIR
jgi:methionyl-tRNA synthetase